MLLRISVPGRLPRSPVAASSRSAQKGSANVGHWLTPRSDPTGHRTTAAGNLSHEMLVARAADCNRRASPDMMDR